MYYANPEVDKMTEIAENTLDEKERLDALAKAQKIIVNDLPSIQALKNSARSSELPGSVPGMKLRPIINLSMISGFKAKY